MDLSIIIVNWKTKDFVRECIRSVVRETDRLKREIIVVDNASFDGCAEMLKLEFGSMHYDKKGSFWESRRIQRGILHLLRIRYANGDLIALADSPCSCGSCFPLISSVVGRTTDILTFPNGRSLSGPALTLIFREMDIDGWQIVKTGSNTIEIRICCSGELPANHRSHILNVLGHHLGSGVDVVIKRVAQLTLTKAGKLKPVWSEVDSGMQLQGSFRPATSA